MIKLIKQIPIPLNYDGGGDEYFFVRNLIELKANFSTFSPLE